MDGRKYYEAYDDRYRQVHTQQLQWFADTPSAIVSQALERFCVPSTARILEIGCGEGRDAVFLLKRGWDVLATDISSEAVAYCQKMNPEFARQFRVLDCVRQRLEMTFDFIYAVAVIHMLVEDADRDGFYSFVREQLAENGLALICTMGDGKTERQSDIRTAFALQERVHEQSGKAVKIAGTSCRMVSFATFTEELRRNGLRLLAKGTTAVEPDFPMMMYAVVTPAPACVSFDK